MGALNHMCPSITLTLQEFSHALYYLMEKVVASSPISIANFKVLLRDQFVEHVSNSDLLRELKRLVRNNSDRSLPTGGGWQNYLPLTTV